VLVDVSMRIRLVIARWIFLVLRAWALATIAFAASVFADLLDDTEMLLLILTGSVDCVSPLLGALVHRRRRVRVSGLAKLLFPNIILMTLEGISS
jgi:hypothetical protein